MKKTVVITGANSGIGKAAALRFAAQGYRVIMACRNTKISEPVCRELIERTNNKDIEVMQLDVSSGQSILAFCEAFRKKYDVLDILINNAGHFKHGETRFQQSADGMEQTFATNLFGPVLLADLLLDVLSKSNDPRILNACSTNIKHFFDERRKIDFKTLCGQCVPGKRYDSYKLYGDSKIGLLMATVQMAQKYKNQGVSVNAVMIPATKIANDTVKKMRSYWRLLAVLQTPFTVKTEAVGDIYFAICTAERYHGITGTLMNHFGQTVHPANKQLSFIKIIRSVSYYPSYADDEQTAKRVWKICDRYIERMTKRVNP